MNWVLLNVEAIEKVHSDLIDQYGGSHGLRDAGLLESAVQRAENKIYFQPESTVAAVAASVSYGLIKNHAFIDGNKRIRLAALVDFLRLNGYRLLPTNKSRSRWCKKRRQAKFQKKSGRLGGTECCTCLQVSRKSSKELGLMWTDFLFWVPRDQEANTRMGRGF